VIFKSGIIDNFSVEETVN